jgi:hypothetical protein
MEFLNFILGVIVTLIVVGVVRIVNQNRELKRKLADMAVQPLMDTAFWNELKKISATLTFMVRGEQLATIFEIGPKSLKVSPEDFVPKKEELRGRLLRAVVDEDHDNPSTWAYCVLGESGFDQFVDGETRLKTQNALARLRTNNDKEAIFNLANDLVDQLCPEAVPV